ncbi:MAG: hypothetical protein PSV22_07300 [Pseudolabrys sp.]|nr:hypothetical protein [Pseudolabrys sp.]
MPPETPDLDRILACRGGYEQATEKLAAYAVIVIRKRSGPTKNGLAVARLDPKELVKNAIARLVEMESFDDGEAVFFQLRRHIDNEVHCLQKSKNLEPRSVAIAAGAPVEGSREVGEPEDCNAPDAADVLEREEENKFNRDLLRKQQSLDKANNHENVLIGHILDEWTERSEIAELMGITVEQYDIVYKRVCRAVRDLKDATLRKAV